MWKAMHSIRQWYNYGRVTRTATVGTNLWQGRMKNNDCRYCRLIIPEVATAPICYSCPRLQDAF